MDMLTGKTGRLQSQALQAQQEQVAAGQRRSLAQMALEQGELDQAAARTGRRGRGRSLLTFLSGDGQATLG